jgi:hypothetical protein
MKSALCLVPLLLLSLLTACSESEQDSISKNIADQVKAGKTVDLANLGSDDWEKLCIVGPYTDNAEVEKILGFPWDIEQNSPTSTTDGTVLLLFIQDKTVVTSVDHPRDLGDFDPVAEQCYERADAQFGHVVDADGWSRIIKDASPDVSP